MTAKTFQEPETMPKASQAPRACHHKDTVLARRASGSGWEFVNQCLFCGAKVGRAVPPAKAITMEYRGWDKDLEMSGQNRQRAARYHHKIESAERQRDWRARYEAHLESPKWKKLRELVMQRSGGLCEGCGVRPARQVHHLTYEHMGDELLWELRAVCIVCHERIHGRSLGAKNTK